MMSLICCSASTPHARSCCRWAQNSWLAGRQACRAQQIQHSLQHSAALFNKSSTVVVSALLALQCCICAAALLQSVAFLPSVLLHCCNLLHFCHLPPATFCRPAHPTCELPPPSNCRPQEIDGRFTLRPLLAAPVEAAVDLSHDIEDHITLLLAAASRDAVLPGKHAGSIVVGLPCWRGGGMRLLVAGLAVLQFCQACHVCASSPLCLGATVCALHPHTRTHSTATVKAFLCCRTMDLLGNQWLALPDLT